MGSLFEGRDQPKPGAATSFDHAASLTAMKPSFVGETLSPIVEQTTKSILATLELGQKLTGPGEEAWVKIMLEQEKRLGSASPRGCYPIRTTLDLNSHQAIWKEQGKDKDPLYLVKNMLNQILDEGRNSKEWELRYPTVKQKQWEENLEKRPPVIRLLIGRPPPLFFVDLIHSDAVQRDLNNSVLLRDICEGNIPELYKDKVRPVSEWFAETPATTPYLAVWVSDSDQSSFKLMDPRMNLMMLRVHNSVDDKHPLLPFQLNGVFAHALTDGEPAKQRLATIWNTALANPKDRAAWHPDQGRIKIPESEDWQSEVKPENPFQEIGFKYRGCEKFTKVLGVQEISQQIPLDEVELGALLKAAKKLGCKSNSLFILGLLGVSSAAPVTSVATNEKNYKDSYNKDRLKRIQIATFGNGPAFTSEQFKALATWVKNPTINLSLDQVLQSKIFRENPSKLSEALSQHLTMYESQLKLAQNHDLGFLTHSAKLADKRRATLQGLVKQVSPHMAALTQPTMQFSTLGAEPTVGNGALHWEFESACSETVVNTFGMIGRKLSFREFLDNPIGLFDTWQLYIQKYQFFPLELLDSTFNNGLLSRRLIDWLRDVVEVRSSKRTRNSIANVPIEIAGIQFPSIHKALEEAGRDANVLEDVVVFLDELMGLTADFMMNSPNQYGLQQRFKLLVEVQAHQALSQAMAMTEAVAHALLVENGHGDSPEAALTREYGEFHKQASAQLYDALLPKPSAQI